MLGPGLGPTMVLMRPPPAVIFRIRLSDLSATYTFPIGSTATQPGELTRDPLAGPPSPEVLEKGVVSVAAE